MAGYGDLGRLTDAERENAKRREDAYLERRFSLLLTALSNEPKSVGVLLRHVFGQEGYAPQGALVWRDFGDHRIFFDPRDDKIAMTLLARRCWQRRYIDRSIAILTAVDRLKSGSTFVDVGANIGTSTLYAMASKMFSDAIAIEPEPRNIKLLDRNIKENDLSERVTIIRRGVSSKSGRARLYRDVHNFGKHSLDMARVTDCSLAAGSLGPVEVRLTTLDQALESRRLCSTRVGLIKIDVEGHGLEVLRGMPRLLEAKVPVVIEAEFNETTHNWAAYRKLLEPHYTRIVELEDRRAHLVKQFWKRWRRGRISAVPMRQHAELVSMPLQAFNPTQGSHELLVY
ncbi:MAG: FkbM family methyltransferase [Pseudomonadota bacterium]